MPSVPEDRIGSRMFAVEINIDPLECLMHRILGCPVPAFVQKNLAFRERCRPEDTSGRPSEFINVAFPFRILVVQSMGISPCARASPPFACPSPDCTSGKDIVVVADDGHQHE